MAKKGSRIKKIIIAGIIVALAGAGIIWYIFTKKFADTVNETADYNLNALDLINEFKKNEGAANKKYAEKLITVTGLVTEVEMADTTVNIKMADTASGSYAIFAFQQQNLQEAKTIKEGDKVAIKGSCSGGAYSQILETEFITFKRCALSK
jgi:flagellar basal body-associated protein FliL